jgi:hypothetical protein
VDEGELEELFQYLSRYFSAGIETTMMAMHISNMDQRYTRSQSVPVWILTKRVRLTMTVMMPRVKVSITPYRCLRLSSRTRSKGNGRQKTGHVSECS